LFETGQPAQRANQVANHVAYRHVRHNVTQMITGDSAAEDVVIPACSEWTACDLVGHLVGISALTIGRMTGEFPVQRSARAASSCIE
jgi:hypothetical protein